MAIVNNREAEKSPLLDPFFRIFVKFQKIDQKMDRELGYK